MAIKLFAFLIPYANTHLVYRSNKLFQIIWIGMPFTSWQIHL